MNWSKRKKVRVLGYSALFKKLGILNELEYKSITEHYNHPIKNKDR